MSRNTDKSNLADLFREPCECIQTSGTQQGIILKFHTFYLKIYDSDKEDSYIVEGYRYGYDSAIFTDIVPTNKMRNYASKF